MSMHGARAGRPKSPAKPQFSRTILVLEAMLLFFATLAAYGLRLAEPAVVWSLGGAAMFALLVASGMVGRPGGYVVGSVVQLVPLVAGLWVPMLGVVGGLFVVMWVVALVLGGRIDRERAEWDAAHGVAGPDAPAGPGRVPA